MLCCRPDVISLAFEEHDTDSDGLLTAAEAEQALKQAARVSMPRFRMKHAIADAEAGSPSISLAEFRTFLLSTSAGVTSNPVYEFLGETIDAIEGAV